MLRLDLNPKSHAQARRTLRDASLRLLKAWGQRQDVAEGAAEGRGLAGVRRAFLDALLAARAEDKAAPLLSPMQVVAMGTRPAWLVSLPLWMTDLAAPGWKDSLGMTDLAVPGWKDSLGMTDLAVPGWKDSLGMTDLAVPGDD
jgi:hypothetical protein